MANKKEPGVTFSIPEIMDTIHRKLSTNHVLTFFKEVCWIDTDYELGGEMFFNSLSELHLWVAKTRIELDEQETEQSAANDKINHESANIDFMNQRF